MRRSACPFVARPIDTEKWFGTSHPCFRRIYGVFCTAEDARRRRVIVCDPSSVLDRAFSIAVRLCVLVGFPWQVRGMYSWADVAERTERAYERALKAPPPSLVRRFHVSPANGLCGMTNQQSAWCRVHTIRPPMHTCFITHLASCRVIGLSSLSMTGRGYIPRKRKSRCHSSTLCHWQNLTPSRHARTQLLR